jgi:hypothetical protein
MGKKRERVETGFVMFDIIYQDGTRSSHRRIPASQIGGLDGDTNAKSLIEEQDRRISDMSGVRRGPIKTIVRSQGQ